MVARHSVHPYEQGSRAMRKDEFHYNGINILFDYKREVCRLFLADKVLWIVKQKLSWLSNARVLIFISFSLVIGY